MIFRINSKLITLYIVYIVLQMQYTQYMPNVKPKTKKFPFLNHILLLWFMRYKVELCLSFLSVTTFQGVILTKPSLIVSAGSGNSNFTIFYSFTYSSILFLGCMGSLSCVCCCFLFVYFCSHSICPQDHSSKFFDLTSSIIKIFIFFTFKILLSL